MEGQKSDKYDNFLVKKETVRYKFVIVLFILSFGIFHPETIIEPDRLIVWDYEYSIHADVRLHTYQLDRYKIYLYY